MTWPKWFPYPRSWFRAFALFLLISGIAAILYIFDFWGTPLAQKAFLDGKRGHLIAWFLFLGILLPVILISYTHHFLWGVSPRGWPAWLPSPQSIWCGFYGWLISNVSSLLGVLIVIPFTNLSRQIQILTNSGYIYLSLPAELRLYITDTQLALIGAIWLLTAAYLYQLEHLLRRRKKTIRDR